MIPSFGFWVGLIYSMHGCATIPASQHQPVDCVNQRRQKCSQQDKTDTNFAEPCCQPESGNDRAGCNCGFCRRKIMPRQAENGRQKRQPKKERQRGGVEGIANQAREILCRMNEGLHDSIKQSGATIMLCRFQGKELFVHAGWHRISPTRSAGNGSVCVHCFSCSTQWVRRSFRAELYPGSLLQSSANNPS